MPDPIDYLIPDLTPATSIDVANDLLIIEDVSVPETKKTTPNTLKTSMSLNNVDNTSDVNKPISTATQTALDTKVDENAAITGATKTKITYDAKGLVTAGADLSASDMPTGIDAAKISGGSISNAEFDYLNGLSDNIQTQLNGKQQSLTLTTTGTSGAATLVGATLNIPQYSGGGGTPSGVSGSVQFNNAGAFGADSNFNWDNTNKRLGLGIAAPLGILHLKVSAGTTRMLIDGDAAQSKIITFRTAGLQRWGLYCNNVAESGSNAGSNFVLRRYNDAGTLLGTPIQFNRATGLTTISEGLDLGGSELTNFSADVVTLTASLQFNAANSATYNSRVIQMSNACAFTFNNDLPIGWSATFIQTDTNNSTFAGVGSVVIDNRQGHSSNNGRYSVVSIVKLNTLQFILGGDTSL